MPRKNRKTYDQVMAEINEKEKIAAKKRELKLIRAREQGRKQAREWAERKHKQTELKSEVESRISGIPDNERSLAFGIELRHVQAVKAAKERLGEPFLSEECATLLLVNQYLDKGGLTKFLLTGRVHSPNREFAEVYLYQTVNHFFRKFGVSSSHHLRSKTSSKIEKPLYAQFLAAIPCDTRIEALVLEDGMPEVVDMGDKDWAYYDKRICHSMELTTLDAKGFKQYCVSAKERINAIGLCAYYREQNPSLLRIYRSRIEAAQWGINSWYFDGNGRLWMHERPVWSPSPPTPADLSIQAKQPLTLCTEKWCREYFRPDKLSNHFPLPAGGMADNRTTRKPGSSGDQQLEIDL